MPVGGEPAAVCDTLPGPQSVAVPEPSAATDGKGPAQIETCTSTPQTETQSVVKTEHHSKQKLAPSTAKTDTQTQHSNSKQTFAQPVVKIEVQPEQKQPVKNKETAPCPVKAEPTKPEKTGPQNPPVHVKAETVSTKNPAMTSQETAANLLKHQEQSLPGAQSPVMSETQPPAKSETHAAQSATSGEKTSVAFKPEPQNEEYQQEAAHLKNEAQHVAKKIKIEKHEASSVKTQPKTMPQKSVKKEPTGAHPPEGGQEKQDMLKNDEAI